MKKLILSLAAVAALASCSQEEGNNVPEVVPGNIPIIVNAGLGASVESKAAVDGSTFADNTQNAFNLFAFTQAAAGDWSANNYFKDLPVNCNAEGEFHTGKFYPAGGNDLYFYAYAPGGDTYKSSGSTVSFTITGQEDIMYAGEATGNATKQPSLSFSHQLMKVKFKAALDASMSGQTVSLSKITIKNVGTKYDLNLATGELTANASQVNGDLSLNVSNQTITEGEAQVVPGEIMIFPDAEFSIEATAGQQTFKTASEVTIASPEKGKEYVITLTFNGVEIVPTVTIVPWQSGDDLEVDVQ